MSLRLSVSKLKASSLNPADYCCHSAANHRRETWRWKRLQLGRKVGISHCHSVRTIPRMSAYEENSAYLLAAASLGPIYGKLSDLIGMELQRPCADLENELNIHYRTETHSLHVYCHLSGWSFPSQDIVLTANKFCIFRSVLRYVVLPKTWYGSSYVELYRALVAEALSRWSKLRFLILFRCKSECLGRFIPIFRS